MSVLILNHTLQKRVVVTTSCRLLRWGRQVRRVADDIALGKLLLEPCGGLPDVIRSQRSPYGTSLLGAGAVHHIRLGPGSTGMKAVFSFDHR
jgi:hypothetical protein